MRIPDRIADRAKAVVGAVGLVVTALDAALADNVLGVDEVGHIISVVIAAGASVYAIFRVPNREITKGTST
jgi:hypothetical protein